MPFGTAASREAGVATMVFQTDLYWDLDGQPQQQQRLSTVVCAIILGRFCAKPEEPSSAMKPFSSDSMSRPLSARRTNSDRVEKKIGREEAPCILYNQRQESKIAYKHSRLLKNVRHRRDMHKLACGTGVRVRVSKHRQ
jgi:hypothetical protein